MVDPTVKAACLHLLRRGHITVTEAARYAFITRQSVHEWCDNAGIDPKRARAAHVAEIFRLALSKDRKPSKAEQRNQAAEAEADWQSRRQ